MPGYHSYAIFNSGTKINPASPADAEYYDAGQVAYVLERPSGSRVVATSFGSLRLTVGSRYDFHHDQSRRAMGLLQVIGTVEFATGITEGEIPDKKLPHFVFK
jgi:hypothetical protein